MLAFVLTFLQNFSSFLEVFLADESVRKKMIRLEINISMKNSQRSAGFIVAAVIKVRDPLLKDDVEDWIRVVLAHLCDHPSFLEVFPITELIDTSVNIANSQEIWNGGKRVFVFNALCSKGDAALTPETENVAGIKIESSRRVFQLTRMKPTAPQRHEPLSMFYSQCAP